MNLSGNQLDAFSGDPNFMLSLAKGIIVAETAVTRRTLPTVSQLSVATGLSRAAVRRCVYTLQKIGYWGRFVLPRFEEQAFEQMYAFEENAGEKQLRAQSPVVLATLQKSARECFSVTILKSLGVHCLAKTPTPQEPLLEVFFAIAHAPHLSSIGHAHLRALPRGLFEHFLLAYQRKHGDAAVFVEACVRYAEHNRADPFPLRLELHDRSVRSISEPVLLAGRTIALLNCSTVDFTETLSDLRRRHTPQLKPAAAHLSASLASTRGFSPSQVQAAQRATA